MRSTKINAYDETSPLLGGDDNAMSKEVQGVSQQEEGREQPKPRSPQHHIISLFTSVSGAIKQTIKNVTLEPMLFLKMLAEGNFKVVADTLEIDRVCLVNLNFTKEECAHMDTGNYTYVQVAVQRFQNDFNYNQSLMDSLIPLAIVLFMGSLSDQIGRKPPMLAVLAGFVALAAVYLLMALRPSWPVQVLYAGTLAIDLTGTWVVFNMAVYSYVADITTPETRTKRLGVLDACWYLGGPLGRLIGGWLYHAAGYPTVFLLSGVLWIICFVYVLVLVHESVDKTAQRCTPQEVQDARFGPLRHVVALLRTAFKSRPGHGRAHLMVVLILKLMVFLVQGHQMYLWARRVLKWGAPEFSTWTSLDSVVHEAGMVAWVWIASKVGLHDTSVAIGGLVSLGMWSAVLACIAGPEMWWLVVVASVVGMLEPCIEPALRTMLTTTVGVTEAGKVLALTGLLESAWFAVDQAIYTSLYNTFVASFPQINFVVQGTLCGLLILVLLLLQLDMNRQPTVTHAPAQPVTNTIYNVQDPESMTGEENACNPCVDTTHSHYM